MIRNITSVLIGLLVFLTCTVAWAQGEGGAEDPNALSQITDLTFSILTVILPIIATWLAHRAISTFESKTKIDIPTAIENRIDDWVISGVHLAAEKSRQKVKEGAAKLTGPEKLEEAADFVIGLAEQQGWIEWSKDRIKQKIEALLGVQRANGGVPKLEDK